MPSGTEDAHIRPSRKCDNISIRLNTVLALDGQTDVQMNGQKW